MRLKNWMWPALMLSALYAGPALAQDIGRPATIGAPAVPQTHSVEQADDKLRQVAKDRAAAEAEFSAAEQVCYTKFFVNSCVDKAKEKRRARLAEVRSVENEASYFKRRHAVELRDRELEDRAQKDAAEAAYRSAHPAPARTESERAAPKPAAVSLDQRAAEQAAKEKQRLAREASEAPQRAASAAEFERKKAAAERRQADVAKRKAEKDEKRRKRAEAEAARGAKPL
jgi:colicin import membrane protein